MKLGRCFVFFGFLLSIAACDGISVQETTQSQVSPDSSYTIQHFIAKHQILEFPFVHNINDDREFGWPIEDGDTVFFPSNAIIAGLLPDTSNYYGFVYFSSGGYLAPNEEILFPYVRTFNKMGRLIAEEDLFDVNSNDCYRHSFEVFMDSQLTYTVTSVSVKQGCNNTNEVTSAFDVEVSFAEGNILGDGIIVEMNQSDTVFSLDSSFVSLINATTKKYTIDKVSLTQTFWISWIDYSTIRYYCSIFSKLDGCEWHYSDTARLYMEDNYKFDKEIGGDHFLHEYHANTGNIQSILVDMRYRNRIRLILDSDSGKENCTLSGAVMHVKPWF